ncbi:MAG: hypothetical protein PVSMB1_05930 [Gemmatimonadaceae bacterium]
MTTEAQGGKEIPLIRAVYPLDNRTFAVLCTEPVHPSSADASAFRFRSGRAIEAVESDEKGGGRLLIRVEPRPAAAFAVDSISIRSLNLADGNSVKNVEAPRFAAGVYNAMQLKVPHFAPEFPYGTSLDGLHVSVACCGGCNGGVHARGLSVLNVHHGGCFSGIWIYSTRALIDPYPRWQRIVCAGGVLEERSGSSTIVDRGWMTARRDGETQHHAPPPLAIETVDVPGELTKALEPKGLDGSYVAFSDVGIESVDVIEGGVDRKTRAAVPAVRVSFSDASRGTSVAWMYQVSAQRLRSGQRLKRLCGFVHAEEPGRYIVLTDKEEDISA